MLLLIYDFNLCLVKRISEASNEIEPEFSIKSQKKIYFFDD
jgi:hypothetical protein